MTTMPLPITADPVLFCKVLWPEVNLYDKQREILYSARDNDETFVPAGNMLGKDFVGGLLLLWFFLSRHPVRIVTTSADYSQLESVLWGEIRRFIQTSAYPLTHDKGGPLLVNHLHIRKVLGGSGGEWVTDAATGKRVKAEPRICGLSYLIGRVAAKGEGMLGHHIADVGDGIPRTMAFFDEASGCPDVAYERASTWAKRIIAIGNCYKGPPGCTFFETNCKAGDLLASDDLAVPIHNAVP